MARKFTFLRLDEADAAFFNKQLEVVRAKTYDIKFAELLARQFIPVDGSLSNGAAVVTYHQYDQVGVAKIISDYATDLPRADVRGKEFSSPIRSIGNSYGFSIQEIRGAKLAGIPLEQKKANAARRAVEQKIDEIAQFGDAENNLLGFLNQPNVILFVVPNGVGGTPDWNSKLPDEIAADMHGCANNIVTVTKGVEVSNTMLLPLEQYQLVASKRMGDGSDTTILDFFLETSPHITEVAPWHALAGAGVGGTDRMAVYRRDQDVLQLVISQEFEQLPPQEDGLEIITPCHARCGGVVVYYPLAISFADGI